MKQAFKIAFWVLLCVVAGALATIYIRDHTIAVLEPQGMIGEAESDLIFTASWLMLIVVIPVFVLTGVFAWKYREGNTKAKHEPDWEHNYIAECCWWGVPCVIIVILAILTWKSSHELNPFKPIESEVAPIQIQVVALDWKWFFIYPQFGIATVNFIQFPEKTPINFEITADAPMNAFWIPRLGGQIYAMPAMRSKLHLIANQVGSYRGVSANISGEGFAGMTFTAQSSSRQDFDAWVAAVKKGSPPMNLEAYHQLEKPSQYNPMAYYVLEKQDLFDWIIMKYMVPAQ